MDIQRLIQKLMESNDFFDKFEENEIEQLLTCCKAKSFKDGDHVFKEDSRGTSFYIIIAGSLLVTKKSKKVDIVREGECIGEMGALSGSSRTATAEAIGKVTTLELDNVLLNRLSANIQAKLYKNIALLISHRLKKRLDRIQ